MNVDFTERLRAELSAASDYRRLEALENLVGGIGGDDDTGRVEEILVDVLRADANSVVRHEAAFVLGKLYELGEVRGEITLGQLCDSALRDCSVVVRHEAAEVLACFNTGRAIATLQVLLDDPDPDVSATARISLERLADAGD
ncbi:MAG: HEAT repeat domain-containing protein [Pyrinomonadaceae bacterium]